MNFDSIKNDLLSLADSGLKYGYSKLPDAEIELYISQSNSTIMNIQGGMVSARDSSYTGLAVRVFNNKKKSFACSSGNDIDSIKSAIDEAITISETISYIDERFNGLYSPNGKASSTEGLLDPDILTINAKTLGNEAEKLIKDCKSFDERIVSVSGNRTVSAGAFVVANSRNVASGTRFTANVGSISCVAKEGDKQKTSFDFAISRTKKDFDLSKAGLKAAEESISLLNSKKLGKSIKMPIIWDYVPAAQYFGQVFGNAITGKGVVEGDSYFADKMGDDVGINNLTVFDDGTIPEAMRTSAIDAEGVPSQKTLLVEKGILKSFINDSYYAHLLETESTGNSQRSANPSYEGLPGIGANTISINTVLNKNQEDLISEIDYGILVKGYLMGIGHTNPVTGDMSAVAIAPYLVEKGEIIGSLEPINIAGNIYKSLKNVSKIGSDINITPFGVNTPTIVIDDLSITG